MEFNSNDFADKQAKRLWDLIKSQTRLPAFFDSWRWTFVFYFTLYTVYIIKKSNIEIDAHGEQTVRGFLEEIANGNNILAISALIKSWNEVFGAENEKDEDFKFNIDEVYEIVKNLTSKDFAYLARKNFSEIFENNDRFGRDLSISPELNKLVGDLFGNDTKDTLLDAYSWKGDFLAAQVEKNNHIIGTYINKIDGDILSMRLAMLGADEKVDVFNMLTEESTDILIKTMKFDRIFLYPPFGVRMDRQKVKHILDIANIPYGTGAVSSELVFIAQVLPLLKDGGKLIATLPNGPLFKKTDRLFREELIRRGLVEQVIALPEGLCCATAIPINILVLSNKNNKTVEFTDATEAAEKRKGLSNRLILSDIFKPENMVKIDYDEIIKNDNILTPKKYVNIKKIEYINPAPLGELIDKCFRGCQIRLYLSRSDKNDLNVITLADMDGDNNTISRHLMGVQKSEYAKLPGLVEKYLVQPGDVLITGRGTTVKFAIVDAQILTRPTIVTENIIVIRPNLDVLDPYYLIAYLRSKDGKSTLENLRFGSVITLINPSDIRDMPISMVDEKTREIVAAEYRFRVEEIAVLKRRLNRVCEELSDLMDRIAKEGDR